MKEMIAVFGGVYNNYLALEATIKDARQRGAERFYCLGDLGGFGPYPNRVFPLLHEHDVQVVKGNYDHSIGHDLEDCGCGYTDPRDNYYAQISYDYTVKHTSDANKSWLRGLPESIRLTFAGRKILMVHGSPRKINEFLWESTSPDVFLEKLLNQYDADCLLCTHTGIPWQRTLPSGKKVINVGAIGRPANDGRTEVFYALLKEERDQEIECVFTPVAYDFERLAEEMRIENLPEEFVETILTGWWTTCLEIMPRIERQRGKY